MSPLITGMTSVVFRGPVLPSRGQDYTDRTHQGGRNIAGHLGILPVTPKYVWPLSFGPHPSLEVVLHADNPPSLSNHPFLHPLDVLIS